MKRILLAGLALVISCATVSAHAGVIDASAIYTSKLDANGTSYDYAITLTNHGNVVSPDPVGTFWFAWKPGQDYMDVAPTSMASPTGWTANLTHGTNQGYAIQWVAGTAAADVLVGTSQTFDFVSTLTPAQLAGNSPFFPGTPETTSVLYNAGPFSADSATILVTAAAVPEPSTLVLSVVGGLILVAASNYPRRRAENS